MSKLCLVTPHVQRKRGKVIGVGIYVTRSVKTGLISGKRNCSYKQYLSAKSFFVNFCFSSKIKTMTLLLHIHVATIAGKLSLKARSKPVTYLGPWNILP